MDKHYKEIEKLLEGGNITLSFKMTAELFTVLMTLREIHYNYESTNLSPRMIHHYIKEGIILTSDAPTKGRNKFNFFQILWLHTVESLRNMGYSLKNIRAIKESLIDKSIIEKEYTSLGKPIDCNVFEFIITLSILSEDQIYLIALQDGRFSFVSDKSILIYTMDDSYLQEPHLNLPLAHLIQGLFQIIPKDSPYSRLSVKWEKPIYEVLSGTEKAIIRDIRKGIYDQISVLFKNGEVETIKRGGKVDTSTKIGEILKKNDFQDITLTVRDGNVIKIISEEIDLKK